MAHPERYEYLKTISDFQALKEKGCNFQLNLTFNKWSLWNHGTKKSRIAITKRLYRFYRHRCSQTGTSH